MSTNQTTNQDDKKTRSTRSRNQRARIAGAAFAFASAVVVASFIVGSHEPATAASPTPPAPAETLAQYAAQNNLAGLSPASLNSAAAETLAQFAVRNNLTGLSPASLAPAPGTND